MPGIPRVAPVIATLLCLNGLAPQVQGALDPEKGFHDFVSDSWSLEEGLPQISVLAITQDVDGYIWVGTQQGLARFDGREFEVYRSDDLDALPGSYIHALESDSRGRLWVGTYKGVALYQEREFFTVTGPHGDGGDEREVSVNTLAETPDGEILVGTDTGLYRIEDRRMTPVELPAPGPVTSLHAHRDGVLVGGLGRYWEYRRGSFDRETPLPAGLESADVTGFARHHGRLWVGTSAGLLQETELGLISYAPESALEGQPVEAIYTDAADTLWIGTAPALLRIQEGRLREFIGPDRPNTHVQIQSIAEDHEGSLWLGSFRDGLARYWSGWTERFSEPQGLHEPLTWSVADAGGGDVWVGTNDGLSLLSDGRYELVLEGRELPHPHAYTLLPQGNRLWIGTRRGVAIFDTETGELERPEALEGLDAHQINGIVPGLEADSYLVPTDNGLYRYRDGHLEDIGPRIGSRMVRQVYVEDDGSLMVATDSGVFHGPPEDPEPLGSEQGLDRDTDYSAIHRLDEEHFILTTIDSGLYVGDHERGWRQLRREEGLPSETGYFVTDDGGDNLWVAGFHGLYHLPLDHLRSLDAGERDRVDGQMLLSESGRHIGSQQTYCCNGAGHAKGMIRDDGLWFPTRGGAIRVDPANIERNPVAPRVIVEAISQGGEWRSILPDSDLTLPADQRDLEFRFTALSFQDPRSVRMRYRLVGYDDDWRELTYPDPRRAAWTNLPPGNYRLEVTGSNNAGVWAAEAASLDFRIRPWFHETLWFHFLIAGLLLALAAVGYRWRVRHLHRRQLELQEEVRARTEELHHANERLVTANRSLRDVSTTDPLTGLRNRRHLYEQLPRDLAHFERLRERLPDDDLVMVFALVDVDHFKMLNDALGHRTGDLILQQLAQRLTHAVRTGDYVIRWGGEEFMVVLREMERSLTPRIVGRLQQRISREPYRIGRNRSRPVTCSVGYAEYPLHPDHPPNTPDWEFMVDLADRALYRVKESGRDGWAVLRPGSTRDPGDFVQIVRRDLAGAIASGRVVCLDHHDSTPADSTPADPDPADPEIRHSSPARNDSED